MAKLISESKNLDEFAKGLVNELKNDSAAFDSQRFLKASFNGGL